MSHSKAMVFFIVSIGLMTMPSILSSTLSTILVEPSTSSQLGNFANNLNGMMTSMTSTISAMSYLGGLIFGMKGALAFREIVEGESSYSGNKEVIENKFTNPLLLKTKIEISVFNFDDIVLNKKANEISYLINEIDKMSGKTDYEEKILVEATKEKYLVKLIDSYLAIPSELRHKKLKNKPSAHEITLEQLNLIENGLKEVENNLLNNHHTELKVMSRFLTNKFDNQELELEIGK
jgi:hypothetical protein